MLFTLIATHFFVARLWREPELGSIGFVLRNQVADGELSSSKSLAARKIHSKYADSSQNDKMEMTQGDIRNYNESSPNQTSTQLLRASAAAPAGDDGFGRIIEYETRARAVAWNPFTADELSARRDLSRSQQVKIADITLVTHCSLDRWILLIQSGVRVLLSPTFTSRAISWRDGIFRNALVRANLPTCY